MELTGASIAILGGGAGIGRSGALALASAGAKIFVGDVNKEKAETVAAEIVGAGGTAFAFHVDVTNDDSVNKFAADILTAGFDVDIVWCHAGVAAAGRVENIPIDDWRWVFDLNVFGNVRALRAFLPAMRVRKSGRFVLTSSNLGLFGHLPPALPYVASKAAQIGLAQGLSRHLASSGIGVTLLLPDLTDTAFPTAARVSGDPLELLADFPTYPPMRANEVAAALVEGLKDDAFVVSLMPDTERFVQEWSTALFDIRRLPTGWPDSQRLAVSNVVVKGRITLDPAFRDEAIALMVTAATRTREESGNIDYRFTADLEDPAVFHLVEVWASEETFQAHTTTDHAQALLVAAASMGVREFQQLRYNAETVA
jgi:NAD(P)-dependent dehydrogenase (short-subunit alcohol dehydrogenase family)/quinol monooxygenase YgiN